ncbi:hypothetical protein HDU67_010387, partial [Dinochytrium kinnereticum]
ALCENSALTKVKDGPCAPCAINCPPAAVLDPVVMCGSDGRKYESMCTFNEAKCNNSLLKEVECKDVSYTTSSAPLPTTSTKDPVSTNLYVNGAEGGKRFMGAAAACAVLAGAVLF